VTSLDRVRFRRADASDSDGIALLHAASWRRHYRGAYSDSFLDGDVVADRLAVWRGRLRNPPAECQTIVAEAADTVVGFGHTVFECDPMWGALLDNLHVASTHQRRGIGSGLLSLIGEAVVRRRPRSALHVWVLEQNASAQAFYAALGGRCVGRGIVEAPGGDPSRLSGHPRKLRYAWTDPAALVCSTPVSP